MDKPVLPPRLSELLDPAARRAGIEGGVKVGVVWSKWDEIVGPEVARHAEPTSLRSGILRVRADSPAWASELTYFAPEILRRANEVAGAALVSEVRIWTGPGPLHRGGEQVDRDDANPPPEGVHRLPRNDGDVDPKSALERAYRAWQSRPTRPFR